MSSRLGGRGRRTLTDLQSVSKLHVHALPDMTTALRLSRRQYWAKVTPEDRERLQAVGDRPVSGDAARLRASLTTAENLVEAAIAFDPRLARKAEWRRRDEGEHVCAGLLAEGDDAPFYKRERHVVNDATMAGEPLKIVISTDDKHVPEHTAAAFIATARIVQQFMPLQIWWQGAWLNDEPSIWRKKGFVFQVPLVLGDMDFSRLEFCIADRLRDYFSYLVMATHATLDLKESWNECGHRADYAFNKDGTLDYARTTKFITHRGIVPTAEGVASTAADWLGWQNANYERWTLEANAEAAGQHIKDTTPAKPMSEAERRQWEKRYEQERKEREAQARREANERMIGV